MARSTPIRLTATLFATAALVTVSACGGDDDGGGGSGSGSTEAFCDEFVALAETDEDAALDPAVLRRVADAAPDEVSAAVDRFVEIATELESLDEDDPSEDDADDFFEMLTDLEESSAEIEAFLVDNCPDLPPVLVSEE